MKAEDILSRAVGLLSGAIAHVDALDLALGAIERVTEAVQVGIVQAEGVEPEAAGAIAAALAVELRTVEALAANLRAARALVRSLSDPGGSPGTVAGRSAATASWRRSG